MNTNFLQLSVPGNLSDISGLNGSSNTGQGSSGSGNFEEFFSKAVQKPASNDSNTSHGNNSQNGNQLQGRNTLSNAGAGGSAGNIPDNRNQASLPVNTKTANLNDASAANSGLRLPEISSLGGVIDSDSLSAVDIAQTNLIDSLDNKEQLFSFLQGGNAAGALGMTEEEILEAIEGINPLNLNEILANAAKGLLPVNEIGNTPENNSAATLLNMEGPEMGKSAQEILQTAIGAEKAGSFLGENSSSNNLSSATMSNPGDSLQSRLSSSNPMDVKQIGSDGEALKSDSNLGNGLQKAAGNDLEGTSVNANSGVSVGNNSSQGTSANGNAGASGAKDSSQGTNANNNSVVSSANNSSQGTNANNNSVVSGANNSSQSIASNSNVGNSAGNNSSQGASGNPGMEVSADNNSQEKGGNLNVGLSGDSNSSHFSKTNTSVNLAKENNSIGSQGQVGGTLNDSAASKTGSISAWGQVNQEIKVADTGKNQIANSQKVDSGFNSQGLSQAGGFHGAGENNTGGQNSSFGPGNLNSAAILENLSSTGNEKIEFQVPLNTESLASQVQFNQQGANATGSISALNEARMMNSNPMGSLEKDMEGTDLKPSSVFERSVVDQVVSKASLISKDGQSEIRVQLDPPSLGTVKIQVNLSGEKVTAHIIADNAIARDIIEKNISQLRSNFSDQGFKVDQMSVNVGNDPREQATNKEKPFFMERGFSRMNQSGGVEAMEQARGSISGYNYSETGGVSVFI